MPRTLPKSTAPAPNSLVASAARIRGGASMGITPRNTSADAWHLEVWDHYRNIGEFRYACDWIGSMLSKALIHGTVETAEGVQKITDGQIAEYLMALFGNADGRAEMFRLAGIHLSVTGECYIVGYPDPDPLNKGEDKWEVTASTKCIRPSTDNEPWKINDITLTEVDPTEVVAIRIWRPDPLDPQFSISPARSILHILRELRKLGQYVGAQIDSRLAGAGILLMPDTMQLPPAPVPDGQEAPVKAANNAEELMAILMEAMATSIKNRDDASSMVPIVVTASAEAIAAVKHMTFWSELDQHAIELRQEAISRLALGMDVPPEVLKGSSDSNHWSAWQADESAIKAHAEPLLKIITTAIGREYLRPLLRDDPEFSGQRLAAYSVVADTSEMRMRPNRSKEALELYNLGQLSGESLRRETGFDETDAMAADELAAWLTQKVASGSTTPELVEAALRDLGVKLTIVHDMTIPGRTQIVEGEEGMPAPVTTIREETQQSPQPPSLKDHPMTGPPNQQTSETRRAARAAGRVPSADVARKASLIAASEQLVFRALERAGNKLKSKMQVKPTCAAAEIYQFVAATDTEFLLDDAWGGVPLIAARAGLIPEVLAKDLHEYTAGLLEHQRPHTYEALEAFITEKELAA